MARQQRHRLRHFIQPAAPNSGMPLIPNRTVGDVMFTLEMSAPAAWFTYTALLHVWTGSQYADVAQLLRIMVSLINWPGVWAAPLGLCRQPGQCGCSAACQLLSFAEAAVIIEEASTSVLCSCFVQVRTCSPWWAATSQRHHQSSSFAETAKI